MDRLDENVLGAVERLLDEDAEIRQEHEPSVGKLAVGRKVLCGIVSLHGEEEDAAAFDAVGGR